MPKLQDLCNKQFNSLYVINRYKNTYPVKWNVLCDCGNYCVMGGTSIKKYGYCRKCGYKKISINQNHKTLIFYQQFIGTKYNKLIINNVIKIGKRFYFNCTCNCGRNKNIRCENILSKPTISCGCYNKEINLYKAGENHYRYNNNVSNWNLKLRESPIGKLWKKYVFKIYKRECVICKSTKRITAHHLYSFSKFKHLRFDLSNVAVLCGDCHWDFHKIYGTKRNLAEQFFEFYRLKTKGSFIRDIFIDKLDNINIYQCLIMQELNK